MKMPLLILIVCGLGSVLMLYIFIESGRPLALVNAIWAGALGCWAIWLIRQPAGRYTAQKYINAAAVIAVVAWLGVCLHMGWY